MSIRLLARTTGAVLAAGLLLPSAVPGASKPSDKQIRTAVRRAEKSPDLWATVNTCNKPSVRPPGNKLMGVRVQMPALGFTTRLYMTIEIEYFSAKRKGFVKTAASYGPKTFGLSVQFSRQAGVNFDFKPLAGGGKYVLRGRATLAWQMGTRVLARVVRTTGHGYKHVDGGDPHGFSADTCTITP